MADVKVIIYCDHHAQGWPSLPWGEPNLHCLHQQRLGGGGQAQGEDHHDDHIHDYGDHHHYGDIHAEDNDNFDLDKHEDKEP